MNTVAVVVLEDCHITVRQLNQALDTVVLEDCHITVRQLNQALDISKSCVLMILL